MSIVQTHDRVPDGFAVVDPHAVILYRIAQGVSRAHAEAMPKLPTIFGLALVGLIGFADAAAAVQCPEGRGIYQAVSTPSQELALSGDKGTLTFTKGRARAAFSFAITQSNGFSRTHIVVSGKNAPSSVVMSFSPDFSPYRGEGAAPYLVTPDLPVGFYYWEPFRSRPDYIDLLPADAWHLIRCGGGDR